MHNCVYIYDERQPEINSQTPIIAGVYIMLEAINVENTHTQI